MPSLPPPVAAAPAAPACPSCDDQHEVVARLRQDLADREAELRELRANQREQVKVIQESSRDATRAKVKLRRLATQAEAASYIAEVEVALESLRTAHRAAAAPPLLELAQSVLASAGGPFAHGDYGTAMDRAAQAEQLIAVAAGATTRARSHPSVSGEVLLQVAIPLRATTEAALRRRPARGAPGAVMLKKGTPLVARASKGSWLRVETEDGRSGWVDQSQLGAR